MIRSKRSLLATVFLFLALAVRANAVARNLDFYFIDTEGGASTLIVTPAGESVLIDTGSAGGRDSKRIVQAAKEAGVQRIDHLLTTHFHTDHFGGAPELAAALPIGTIYDNGIPDHFRGERIYCSGCLCCAHGSP